MDSTIVSDWYREADQGDWSLAMERAQRVAKTIYVPAGRFELNRPIRNVSNRRWIGTADTTLVARNHRLPRDLQCVWMLGNTHPVFFGHDLFDDTPGQGAGREAGVLKPYPVSREVFGDLIVLARASDSRDFRVGQFIVIRTKRQWSQMDGSNTGHYPFWAHFTKVKEIRGVEIRMADPVERVIADPVLSPIDGVLDPYTKLPWELVENVEIENFSVDATSAFSTRTGLYNGRIHDIRCVFPDHLLALNCIINSSFSHIHGHCRDRVFELKNYSRGSQFDGISGTLCSRRIDFAPVDVGEQSSNCKMDDVSCIVPSTCASIEPVIVINGSDITVGKGCRFIQDTRADCTAVAAIRANNFLGFEPRGIKLCGDYYSGGSAAYHLQVGGQGSLGNPRDFSLVDFNCFGYVRHRKSVRVFSRSSVGAYDNIRMPYGIVVD